MHTMLSSCRRCQLFCENICQLMTAEQELRVTLKLYIAFDFRCTHTSERTHHTQTPIQCKQFSGKLCYSRIQAHAPGCQIVPQHIVR